VKYEHNTPNRVAEFQLEVTSCDSSNNVNQTRHAKPKICLPFVLHLHTPIWVCFGIQRQSCASPQATLPTTYTARHDWTEHLLHLPPHLWPLFSTNTWFDSEHGVCEVLNGWCVLLCYITFLSCWHPCYRLLLHPQLSHRQWHLLQLLPPTSTHPSFLHCLVSVFASVCCSPRGCIWQICFLMGRDCCPFCFCWGTS